MILDNDLNEYFYSNGCSVEKYRPPVWKKETTIDGKYIYVKEYDNEDPIYRVKKPEYFFDDDCNNFDVPRDNRGHEVIDLIFYTNDYLRKYHGF